MTDRISGEDRGHGRGWTAGLVLAGSVLLSLHVGVLRVALPFIRDDLDTGITGIQVVGGAGLVVVTATLVAFGRLADLSGAARVYATGLAGFAVGLVVSALAPSLTWLVLAQMAQGVGWSMCVGSGPALLVRGFPASQRSRALAGNHMAIAAGLGLGPALGGVVVEQLGWRWGFAGLGPPALTLAGLATARLPAGNPDRDRTRSESFDLAGSAVLASGLVALLLLVLGAGALDADLMVILVAASVTALAGFLILERRSEAPLFDLRLFADRRFSFGVAASFLDFVAMAANMFLLPFLLVDHLALGATRAGMVMAVVPLTIVAAAPMAGIAADRIGSRRPATAGLGALTLAIVAMAALRPGTPLGWVVAVLALYGVGAALFQSPNVSDVLGTVVAGRVGMAAGALATAGRLGQVLGVAVAGGVWQAGLRHHGSTVAGTSAAFRDAFLVLACFGFLAMVASWARGDTEPVSASAGAERPAGHAGGAPADEAPPTEPI
ncbi:MAG TPA: MFS transporter [Acidimicrobiales bacterium]|nr:MFS transporter [Acidimicrobiales bacterium]